MKKHLDEQLHTEKIGTMIEEMENVLRADVEEIYVKKTKEVVIIILIYIINR
jgi:hypothetical protein